jgi:hypothetical protein
MATYMALTPVSRVENGTFASTVRSNTLGASILAGFGMFGLAANGMCLTALADSLPEVPKASLAVARKHMSSIRTERCIG